MDAAEMLREVHDGREWLEEKWGALSRVAGKARRKGAVLKGAAPFYFKLIQIGIFVVALIGLIREILRDRKK